MINGKKIQEASTEDLEDRLRKIKEVLPTLVGWLYPSVLYDEAQEIREEMWRRSRASDQATASSGKTRADQ